MLFDKLWAQVKGAERAGKLTVEEALDCATRLPQALFCSMMECPGGERRGPGRSPRPGGSASGPHAAAAPSGCGSPRATHTPRPALIRAV